MSRRTGANSGCVKGFPLATCSRNENDGIKNFPVIDPFASSAARMGVFAFWGSAFRYVSKVRLFPKFVCYRVAVHFYLLEKRHYSMSRIRYKYQFFDFRIGSYDKNNKVSLISIWFCRDSILVPLLFRSVSTTLSTGKPSYR